MPPLSDKDRSALDTAVYRIIRAIARLAIPLGMSAGAMNELVRRAYVDAADDLIKERGQKPLTTTVCVMTGLYRKEIIRLRNLPPLSNGLLNDKYNRSTRVITGWLRDPDFQTSRGHPAVLKQDGPNSFAELVKRYSGDMAPIAMRQELEYLGVLTINTRNQVKLVTSGYIPNMPAESLHILGADTADLVETIRHNILSENDDSRFQRKVSYVNLPQKYVDPFRQFSKAESQKLLEKLDRWLAKRDNEGSTESETGSRIGIGIYHIENSNSDNHSD